MKRIMTIVLLTIVSATFAIAQNGTDEQGLIRLHNEWTAVIERDERARNAMVYQTTDGA